MFQVHLDQLDLLDPLETRELLDHKVVPEQLDQQAQQDRTEMLDPSAFPVWQVVLEPLVDLDLRVQRVRLEALAPRAMLVTLDLQVPTDSLEVRDLRESLAL